MTEPASISLGVEVTFFTACVPTVARGVAARAIPPASITRSGRSGMSPLRPRALDQVLHQRHKNVAKTNVFFGIPPLVCELRGSCP